MLSIAKHKTLPNFFVTFLILGISLSALSQCKGSDSGSAVKSSPVVPVDRPYIKEISMSNLVVSPASLEMGQPVNISIDLSNNGASDATEITLRYYRSLNNTISNRFYSKRDIIVGEDELVGDLAVAASTSESVVLDTDLAGIYYYGACVIGTVSEVVGTNCITGIKVDVTPRNLPVFTLANPAVDQTSINAGESVSFSVDVSNVGLINADNFELHYYRSIDEDIHDGLDDRIGSKSFPNTLAVGESFSTTATVNLLEQGAYFYGACVDSVAVLFVRSCTTGIQVSTDALAPPAPDALVLENLALNSGTYFVGRPIEIGVDVKNNTANDVLAGTITYYSSTDAIIDNTDTVLGTSDYSTITAGGSERLSETFQATTLGSYYYGACLGTDSECSNSEYALVEAPTVSGSSTFSTSCDLTRADSTTPVTITAGTARDISLGATISDAEITIAASGTQHYLLKIIEEGTIKIWTTGPSDMVATLSTGDCTLIDEAYYLADGGPGGNTNFVLEAKTRAGYYFLLTNQKDLSESTSALNITHTDYSPSSPNPVYQFHIDENEDFDINVQGAWQISDGADGLVVAVVDDGMETNHPDLAANNLAGQSYNYVNQTTNPDLPDLDKASEHGTSVAGLIAAVGDNAIGVKGVAHRASLVAYNFIQDGTDSNLVDAMTRNKNIVAVSSNSWGGRAFFHTYSSEVYKMAVDDGINNGYGGKGTLYVFAAGNNATREISPGVYRPQWDSNNGYTPRHYAALAVCAIERSGIRASYSAKGANVWVCAPTSVATTDNVGTRGYNKNSDYHLNFKGTSAATPIVAGVATLIRDANDTLTWRDVRLIIASTARKIDVGNMSWFEGAPSYNGTDYTGKLYNHSNAYGFGLIDAAAAVTLAENWTNVVAAVKSDVFQQLIAEDQQLIPNHDKVGLTSTLAVTDLNSTIDFIESIEINLEVLGSDLGDVVTTLTSPSGIVSTLTTRRVCSIRPFRCLVKPRRAIDLTSHRHIGEKPDGVWTLKIVDQRAASRNYLYDWTLLFRGHKKP